MGVYTNFDEVELLNNKPTAAKSPLKIFASANWLIRHLPNPMAGFTAGILEAADYLSGQNVKIVPQSGRQGSQRPADGP